MKAKKLRLPRRRRWRWCSPDARPAESRARRSPKATTSSASSPARKALKPACGSSPRRASCRRSTPRSSSPTSRAASRFRICRRRGTACGCAGTGWWTARRCRRRRGARSTCRRGARRAPKEAAEIYPSMYWFSLLKVPAASEFPLGPVASQQQWLNTIKQGACQSCHALGTPGMRKVPELFMKMGKGSSHEAWRNRLRAGSAQNLMARDISRAGRRARDREFRRLDRPHRQGRAAVRQAAAAARDRAQPRDHDVGLPAPGVLPARRGVDRPQEPARQSGGGVYGSPEDSTDIVPVLDPRTNRRSRCTTRCATRRRRR